MASSSGRRALALPVLAVYAALFLFSFHEADEDVWGRMAGGVFRTRTSSPVLTKSPWVDWITNGFRGLRSMRCTKASAVERGFEMGRPSMIDLEIDKRDGEIVAIRVGGSSVLVGRGEIDLPR